MAQPPRDSGYTLLELMVVIALMSAVAAIAVGGWKNWAAAEAQKGAATDLQTIMRQTQMRAVTEGQNFCVKFNAVAGSYSIYRYACAPTGNVKVNGPYTLGDPRVELSNIHFDSVAPATATQVTFKASGTATPGGLTITRIGSAKTYTLDVEGLTGRVTVS